MNRMNLIFTSSEKCPELNFQNVEQRFRENIVILNKHNTLSTLGRWTFYTLCLINVLFWIPTRIIKDTEVFQHGLLLAIVIGLRVVDRKLLTDWKLYTHPLF